MCIFSALSQCPFLFELNLVMSVVWFGMWCANCVITGLLASCLNVVDNRPLLLGIYCFFDSSLLEVDQSIFSCVFQRWWQYEKNGAVGGFHVSMEGSLLLPGVFSCRHLDCSIWRWLDLPFTGGTSLEAFLPLGFPYSGFQMAMKRVFGEDHVEERESPAWERESKRALITPRSVERFEPFFFPFVWQLFWSNSIEILFLFLSVRWQRWQFRS